MISRKIYFLLFNMFLTALIGVAITSFLPSAAKAQWLGWVGTAGGLPASVFVGPYNFTGVPGVPSAQAVNIPQPIAAVWQFNPPDPNRPTETANGYWDFRVVFLPPAPTTAPTTAPTPPSISGPTSPTNLGPAPPLIQTPSGPSSGGGGAPPPPPPLIEEDWYVPAYTPANSCAGVNCPGMCSGGVAYGPGYCVSGECRYDSVPLQVCNNFGAFCSGGECVSNSANPAANNIEELWDCAAAPLQPILSWRYWEMYGSPQSAYQIKIGKSVFYGAISQVIIDTGEVKSSSNSYVPPPSLLSFNTTYYWQVRVKDSKGAFGVWSQWSGARQFATPLHQSPEPDFTWTPQSPKVGETVTFKDQTRFYTQYPNTAWVWQIPDAKYVEGADQYNQNPKAQFLSRGEKQVTLRATDRQLNEDQNTQCSGDNSITKTVKMGFSFPSWQEILPW